MLYLSTVTVMRLDTRIAIIIYMLSLSTLILNSMDRQVNVWLPKIVCTYQSLLVFVA